MAQSPIVHAQADRNDMLIGEQLVLTVKTSFPTGAKGNSTVILPDSIPHFELVENGKPEIINEKGDLQTVQQQLTITSFDSGRWAFPSLAVQVANADGAATEKLQTDSFFVNVTYAKPDSTNEPRDIKTVIDVKIPDYTWLYITGGVLALLLIAYGIWRYLQYRKRKVPVESGYGLPAFEEAMQALEKLGLAGIPDEAAIKPYHTAISDIFKKYLGRRLQKSFTDSTTSDLLILLKSDDLASEQISALATVLRCGDAVKFAKYLPLNSESEGCRNGMMEAICQLENKIAHSKI